MANIVDEVNRDLWNGMKNTPERLLRLIRTIQQIHDWNKKHGYKTVDNYEQLKNKYIEEMERHEKEIEKLNKKAEKDFKKIYGDYRAMHDIDSMGFEAMLPQSYEQLKKQVVFIVVNNDTKKKQLDEVIKNAKQGKYRNNTKKLEEDITASEWTTEQVAKAFINDWKANGKTEQTKQGWKEISQNDDFQVVMDEYANEYEDLYMDEFRNDQGDYDFFRLDNETEITEDLFEPIAIEIVQDEDIKLAIEETNQERKEKALQTWEQERDEYIKSDDMEL